MFNLHCIDLKKENVAYVLYAIMKSGSLAPVPQEITAFPWRSGQGKTEDDGNRFVRFDWTCAQRLRRQKMIEVSSCYLIYSFYFHVEDEGKRRTHSCSVVGKGQSQAVVSLWTLHTSGCQPSKRSIVFLSLAPHPAPACLRQLHSSASAGLQQELWTGAVRLCFNNAPSRLGSTLICNPVCLRQNGQLHY